MTTNPVRRKYTKEYKAEVVAMYKTTDKSMEQVAKDLGLSASVVQRWVARAEIDAGQRAGTTSDDLSEIALLRRENRILREERDILKRATVFFAKETR
jgi:transposase